MTKKAEKAKQVAEAKRSAWHKKVNKLIRHAFYLNTATRDEMNAAYDAGVEAETFAASIAAKEPVGKLLHTQKVDAVKNAGDKEKAAIELVRSDLTKHDWNRTAVAPYIGGRERNNIVGRAKFEAFDKYTKPAPREHGRWDESTKPFFVVMDDERCERWIGKVERDAAWEYDAFIIKMVNKIGPCDSAEIEGSHIWGHSILTVTKLRDVGDNHTMIVERWKTQQITNCSKLGLYFPQWPSRLMKG